MKKCLIYRILLAFLLFVFTVPAGADEEQELRAQLSGFQEPPSISTTGSGKFRGRIRDAGLISFELTYSGLEAPATASHIHLGQRGVNGGVSAFLCGGGGKPACPPSGTVTGTITAADVIGPAGQGIAAGEFAELLRAIRSGNTYVNVHSTKFPGGEIRGQIKTDDEEDEHDHPDE